MNEFPWIGPTDWGLLLTPPIVLYLGVLTANSVKPTSLSEKDLTIGIFTAPTHLNAKRQVSLLMAIPVVKELIVAAMMAMLLATVFFAALCYSGLLTFLSVIAIEFIISLIDGPYEITRGWEWVVTFNAFLLIVAAISSRLSACLSEIQQRGALIGALGAHFAQGRIRNNGEVDTMTEEEFTELCDTFFSRRNWTSF